MVRSKEILIHFQLNASVERQMNVKKYFMYILLVSSQNKYIELIDVRIVQKSQATMDFFIFLKGSKL